MKLVPTRLRRSHVLMLVALAFAALGAASAAPAEAKAKPKAKSTIGCGFETGAAEFSSLARLAPESTARAFGKDVIRERNTTNIVSDSNIPAGEEPATSSSFAASVPVYFHVVTDGRTGWMSRSTVNEQIKVLNLSLGGFYGGVDTGFKFVLKGLDYTNNAGWFAQETFAQELEMKRALKKGGSTALNVYSTSGGGFLGWAYYPSIVVYQKYQVLDGVVIHYGSVPGGHIERFNLGFTATHEVGHWLGLAHTFEQGCQGHGDYIDDTPKEATPTSRCPFGKDTCPEAGVDPIHNYMDYSDDACYNQFTRGQAVRGQQQYLHWRVKHGYK